jgi:hypothetical protein
MKSINVWKDALIRFKKHKLALYSLITLLGIIVLSIIIPMVNFYEYDFV